MSPTDADPRSDDELLRAHVSGQSDAFTVLFDRHRHRLWAVALRTTQDPEEAADGLQDAMISAFRRADTFAFRSKVSTWLYRIVVNACLDRLRRRKSKPVVSMSEWVEAVAPSPHDPIGEHETRIIVRDALGELPDEQRAAIVLVDLEGWSVSGAAEILGCPPGTVKSRCARGRARLAELLRNHGEGGDVPPSRTSGEATGYGASDSGTLHARKGGEDD